MCAQPSRVSVSSSSPSTFAIELQGSSAPKQHDAHDVHERAQSTAPVLVTIRGVRDNAAYPPEPNGKSAIAAESPART